MVLLKIQPVETLTVVVLVAICSSGGANFEKDVKDTERFNLGKEQYAIMQRDASAPKYGQCWKGALVKLDEGCKQLTDHVQHKLALRFTSCYMEKLGRRGYPCDDHEDISECTRDMDDAGFQAMTTFFTHTQNMCFFLQSQVWQENTERTVSRLAETSDNVVQKLDESSELQDKLLGQQNTSLKNQQEMLEKSQSLATHIESSSSNIQSLMKEFKDSTNEQRMMLAEVFDRVAKLQSIVIGEFTGFYSFLFYTLSIAVCYLLTSTVRTSGARFYLFSVMTVDVFIERAIISFYNTKGAGYHEGLENDPDSLLYSRLWLCRKVFSCLGVIILMVCAVRFKDYNKINNSLLIEIQKQNSELKKLLSPQRAENGGDFIDSSQVAALTSGAAEVDLRLESNKVCHNDAVSSSSSSSSESGLESDHTYVADDSGDESDDSVMTHSSISSRDSAFRNSHSSTPVRERTPVGLRSDHMTHTSSASVTMGDRPGTHRYNLRQRTPITRQNPALSRETEADFYKLVKRFSHIARRNTAKAKYTLVRTQQETSSEEM